MPITGPPIPQQKKSLLETLFQSVKAAGNTTFLMDEGNGKNYSYYELYSNASSISVSLQKLGVAEGTVVATLAESSFESFSFSLGVFFAKGVYTPMNYASKADEIKKILEISKAKIIFAGEKYVALAEEAIKNIGWGIKIITDKNSAKYQCYQNLTSEDFSKLDLKISNPDKHIYAIYFTSGTTGIPKGAMLSDQSAYNTAFWCMDWVTSESKILISTPIFWISNIMLLSKSLCDNKIVVIPGAVNAKNVAKCITKTKPEGWFTGAAILLDMCQLPNINEYDFSSFKNIYVGGSILLSQHKKLIVNTVLKGKNVLKNIFGSTESGVITVCPRPIDIESPKYNSIGTLTVGVELKVVDISSGQELGPNREGEFCVKTACVMAGYINEGLKDDFDSEGWWHMGDIGYYDEDGYIYYTRRLKDILKYRALQIAPAELEKILLKHPGIYEASVVGKPHVIDGEWPTAFVVRKNPSVTEKEIEEFVSGQVPDSKRLRGGVHFVDEFPRSAVGKILKTELLKLLK